MKDDSEKTSEFARLLRQLLDETDIFNRQEWAEFLDVSESAISQWLHDQTLPRPDTLRQIVGVVRSSSGVPESILKSLEEGASRPAEEVSPHGKRMGESLGAYLISPLLKGFLRSLGRLGVQVQEKLLLRFSQMCAEEAGVFKVNRERPVERPSEEVTNSRVPIIAMTAYAMKEGRGGPESLSRLESAPGVVSVNEPQGSAFGLPVSGRDSWAEEAAMRTVVDLEQTAPAILSQMAIYLLGSDSEQMRPLIKDFCVEALVQVRTNNNTEPWLITERIIRSLDCDPRWLHYESARQALDLLFLVADDTVVLVEEGGSFVRIDNTFENNAAAAAQAVEALATRKVLYKSAAHPAYGYAHCIIRDGKLEGSRNVEEAAF